MSNFFLVGGAVRDLLMQIPPSDRDYVVVGSTIDEMLAQGFTQVGSSFPVFLHPTTNEEYALARTERKTGIGYNGFDTRFDPSITLEEDLKRRDLTINSMAMTANGTLVDPYGGFSDLKAGILRHTSEAFSEDPLRVLRLARFAAKFNFQVAPETIELAKKIIAAGELNSLPRERLWTELYKGLECTHPKKMIDVLLEVGAAQVLPLSSYVGKSQLRRDVRSSPDVNAILMLGSIIELSTDEVAELKIPSKIVDAVRFEHHLTRAYAKTSEHQLNATELLDLMKKIHYGSKSPALTLALEAFAFRCHLENRLDRHQRFVNHLNAATAAIAKIDFETLTKNVEKRNLCEFIEGIKLNAIKSLT